ncbi:MAG: hypothetical protein ABI866_01705 [Dokdonella sp.]
MSISSYRFHALVLTVLLSPSFAVASPSGTCHYVDSDVDITLTIVDGVAYQEPNPFDPRKVDTQIVLSSVKLDTGPMVSAKNIEHVVDAQAGNSKGGHVMFTLNDGKLTRVAAYPESGRSLSRESADLGTATLSRSNSKGLAGSVETKFSSDGEVECTTQFDMDFLRVPSVSAKSS